MATPVGALTVQAPGQPSATTITMPKMSTTATSLVRSQLIAYRTAAFVGTDIDQPRNLAKSVTVE